MMIVGVRYIILLEVYKFFFLCYIPTAWSSPLCLRCVDSITDIEKWQIAIQVDIIRKHPNHCCLWLGCTWPSIIFLIHQSPLESHQFCRKYQQRYQNPVFHPYIKKHPSPRKLETDALLYSGKVYGLATKSFYSVVFAVAMLTFLPQQELCS